MQPNDDDKIRSSLDSILSEKTFYQIALSSSIELKPSINRLSVLIMICIFFNLLFIYANEKDFYHGMHTILELSSAIILAILAFLITVYTIFQAMLSTETLKTFLIQHSENQSLLIRYNHFFFILTISYLIFFICNFIVLSIGKIVPDLIKIFNFTFLKILSALYLTILVNMLVELKSFIFNLYQSCMLKNISQAIDILKKYNDLDK